MGFAPTIIPWFRVSLLVVAVVGVISFLQLLPVSLGRKDMKEGPWLLGLFLATAVQALLIFTTLSNCSIEHETSLLWWRHANIMFMMILYAGLMKEFLFPWGQKLYTGLALGMFLLLCLHFVMPKGAFVHNDLRVVPMLTRWGEPVVVFQWTSIYFYWIFAGLAGLIMGAGTTRAVQIWDSDEKHKSKILWAQAGIAITVLVVSLLADLRGWGLYFSPLAMLCTQVVMSFDFIHEAMRAKELDDKLRAQTLQIQEMAAKVPGVLFSMLHTTDGQLTPLFLSASFQSMFSLEPSDPDVIEKFLMNLTRADQQRFTESLSKSLQTHSEWHFSAAYPLSMGKTLWFQCAASPMKHPDGTIFNGVLVDVSERVQSIRFLEEMSRQIQLRKDEQESLLYSLSHDLRAPFFNIDGFSMEALRFLEEKIPRLLHAMTPSVSRQARVLKIIQAEIGDSMLRVHRNVEKASDLVTQLLVIGRHSRDQLSIARLQPDVLFHQVFSRLRAEMEPVKLNLIGRWPTCSADPSQLSLVFSTILANAAQYRDPLRPLRLEVSARIVNGRTRIVIQDNGIGFAPEYSEIIFKAFHRLHPDDQAQGRGIGLTIARLAMRRMDGALWAEGKPCMGATFTLELPS